MSEHDEPVEIIVDEHTENPSDQATATTEPAVESVPDDRAIGADTSAVAVSPDADLAEAVGGGLTWIPYAVYLAAWLALAGASAYFLKDATPENPARWMPEYEGLVWGGIGLVALGPVLSLGVWLVARGRRQKPARRGLFTSALIRGALIAFFGAVIWLVTLYVLELVAAGVLL